MRSTLLNGRDRLLRFHCMRLRLIGRVWLLLLRRGQDTFDTKYKEYGLETIWGWDANSGILPCRVRQVGSRCEVRWLQVLSDNVCCCI